jgi:AcrR family transcriptional regulator
MDPEERIQTLRWRRRKDARPAEILSAALACFAERGFAATRLDDVALRAGVTKGTVYLYFQNKEELFKAVVRQALLPNIERVEALIGEATAPAPLLLERLIASFSEVISSPVSAIPKLVLAEAGNFPDLARFYLDEVVHRGTALVRRVLRTGIERGEFREVDLDSTVMCVIAPMIFAALWRHSLGRHEPAALDPRALGAAHLSLLLDGLVAHPGAAPRITDPAPTVFKEESAS